MIANLNSEFYNIQCISIIRLISYKILLLLRLAS